MSNSNVGFYIRKVIVIGKNVEDVFINFEKGFNIISGPSDTGKSYIFECINYMLGSSDEPKKITESKGYSSVLMEIATYGGETYTLKRTFGKEEVEVYNTAYQYIEQKTPIILKYKHDKDNKDNLSAFLLEKSGFKHPSYVKKKKNGEVRTLSFRDLPIYITVSESEIIKENSPILSGQYTKATVEKSVFKLIVSGLDDSDNQDNQGENISSKTKLEGQKELLERLIYQEEKELLSFPAFDLSEESMLDNKMKEIQEKLKNINEEIKNLTNVRRSIWNQIEEDKSKYIAMSELIKRFELLEEQYNADLERLSFVREGIHYFSQLNFSICPFCNQKVEDIHCNVENCGFNQIDENLTESIEAEMNKIRLHLSDLKSTIKESKNELDQLLAKIEENKNEYNKINDKINLILEPKEINLKKLLDNYIHERDLITNYKLRVAKIEDLNKEKKLIEDKLKKQSKKVNSRNYDGAILSAYKDFCEYMASTLKRWKFSKNPNVTFKDGEFFIDSKSTKDYGKGYRAIIYSAFAISLLEFCKANDKPHPGFVVLDSPLTTYKGKKHNEEVGSDIQTAFFEDLSSIHNDMQVIILENKEPSDEIKEKINYIEFTKDNNYGRYGFFPVTK
ncbi:AAA family ATPase [Parageobacillus toebii]|uniref:AAA family ATPase n=1 Tax=Parageobacillus toebii TaxID=153151 RepID=UPI002E1D2621|nr:AAA family ATPase [Parageobacillus toebii]MED4970720.1 AAA family ATPase [Parageobacillus toebii]